MADEKEVVDRLRELLRGLDGASERAEMCGGLAFLVNEHMAVAASGEGGLLARIDPA